MTSISQVNKESDIIKQKSNAKETNSTKLIPRAKRYSQNSETSTKQSDSLSDSDKSRKISSVVNQLKMLRGSIPHDQKSTFFRSTTQIYCDLLIEKSEKIVLILSRFTSFDADLKSNKNLKIISNSIKSSLYNEILSKINNKKPRTTIRTRGNDADLEIFKKLQHYILQLSDILKS